jgi:transposase-like protein
MPWKETRMMDEKIRMIGNWLPGEYSITELSRIHEVSRKTLYKWIERYEADRDAGLKERSSRPLEMPRATPAELVAEILNLKSRHGALGCTQIVSLAIQSST